MLSINMDDVMKHSGVDVSGHEGVKKKRRKMYVIY